MSFQESYSRVRAIGKAVDGPASTANVWVGTPRPVGAGLRHAPFECAVLFVFGVLAVILGTLMTIPAIVEIAADGKDRDAFLWAAALSIFAGMALVLTNRQENIVLNIRQTFLLTTLAWFGLSFLAAIPFMFGHLELSLADAWFETVSGLTTTGSTVLTGLDSMAPGILLWRALLQWIGGLGIIVVGVAILPFLRVGGMQLFRTESSDRSEKLFGRVNQIAAAMLYVYGGLSVLCAALYWVGGMTVFEAIVHAMTTLSTGGYSTSDQSLGHFPNPFVHWTATVFMLAGGLPVVPLAHALTGGVRSLFANSQIRAILGFLAVVIATLTLWLWARTDMPMIDALRLAAFNIVSVVTTTGYANADYGQWGPFAIGVFFLLLFVGGCTGSTGGGIKIFRFQVISRIIGGHFRSLVTPHAVSVTMYEGRLLDDGVIRSVMIFTATFIATVIALGLLLVALGLDFMTSFSGAATAVANVGPGLGDVIGPSGTFTNLPDAAKWVLAVGMLLGRLEFFTVLVVLTPRFWRG